MSRITCAVVAASAAATAPAIGVVLMTHEPVTVVHARRALLLARRVRAAGWPAYIWPSPSMHSRFRRAAAYAPLPLWPPLLAVVTIAYYRRRTR